MLKLLHRHGGAPKGQSVRDSTETLRYQGSDSDETLKNY